jgi:hypothetical protein
MDSAGKLDDRLVPAEESLDVGEVFLDSDLVALPLVVLPPLVVVVKNQRDDVVEIIDEAVRCHRVDELVKPAVEVGEVMITLFDLCQESVMLSL